MYRLSSLLPLTSGRPQECKNSCFFRFRSSLLSIGSKGKSQGLALIWVSGRYSQWNCQSLGSERWPNSSLRPNRTKNLNIQHGQISYYLLISAFSQCPRYQWFTATALLSDDAHFYLVEGSILPPSSLLLLIVFVCIFIVFSSTLIGILFASEI